MGNEQVAQCDKDVGVNEGHLARRHLVVPEVR
jgi:hypothetical protein